MISGGFALAYQELLPEFERTTGIKVVTTSGASQGTGPTIIKAQLERGARPDVVILSKEGLEELIAANRIVDGTEVGLASSPLGAAVRAREPEAGRRHRRRTQGKPVEGASDLDAGQHERHVHQG